MLLADDGVVLACAMLAPNLHAILQAPLAQAPMDAATARGLQVEQDTHGGTQSIIGLARVVLPAQIEQARGWSILMQQDPSETFEPLLALMGKLGAFWVGARVSTRFTAVTGVRLKQTALDPRNPANRPDAYERVALEAFADSSYPREKVISEMAANSSSLRLMFPLYATRQCLDCHGGLKGGLDRTGYPREGLTLGQSAGAISVLLPVGK